MMAFDHDAKKLFLPGLRMPSSSDKESLGTCGFCRLDGAGLPVKNAAGTAPELTIDADYTLTNSPAILGYAPVSDGVNIACSYYGPMTWDRDNRRAHSAYFYLIPSAPYTYRMIGHPTLPVVLFSMIGYPSAFRMEHADGYLTMLPQCITVNGARFQSNPVLLARQKKLAIGGINRVHVLTLDDEGYFTGQNAAMIVDNPSLEALAYSEKFDRLYVTVDKLPK
jgi:hypothetical protein